MRTGIGSFGDPHKYKFGDRRFMNTRMLRCEHCGTDNAVAACRGCWRYFVVTASHLAGELRAFDSQPVDGPPDRELDTCDLCAPRAAGLGPLQAVQAGLSQQTCPHCHTEFLSGHGLYQQRASLG